MDIFSELKKQLKENKDRWEKIDNLIKVIKETEDPKLDNVVDLIILIAEQIRPPKDATDQIKDLQKDINNILSDLKK